MGQIKRNQILPEIEKRPNPAVGLPRDLYSSPQRDLSVPNVSPSESAPVNGPVGVPQAPAILGIKEQIVIFNPDGTAKIDLILEVEDVDTAVEYDVRVTKVAGNV